MRRHSLRYIVDNVLWGDIALGNHKRFRQLASFLVRDTNYGCVIDVQMSNQQRLELSRGDLGRREKIVYENCEK